MTDLTLTPVRRRDAHNAVRFDGTREHAEAIINWVHDAHGGEVGRGHFNGSVYLGLRSGRVIRASTHWWIVQSGPTDFAAFSPAAFANTFEVVI